MQSAQEAAAAFLLRAADPPPPPQPPHNRPRRLSKNRRQKAARKLTSQPTSTLPQPHPVSAPPNLFGSPQFGPQFHEAIVGLPNLPILPQPDFPYSLLAGDNQTLAISFHLGRQQQLGTYGSEERSTAIRTLKKLVIAHLLPWISHCEFDPKDEINRAKCDLILYFKLDTESQQVSVKVLDQHTLNIVIINNATISSTTLDHWQNPPRTCLWPNLPTFQPPYPTPAPLHAVVKRNENRYLQIDHSPPYDLPPPTTVSLCFRGFKPALCKQGTFDTLLRLSGYNLSVMLEYIPDLDSDEDSTSIPAPPSSIWAHVRPPSDDLTLRLLPKQAEIHLPGHPRGSVTFHKVHSSAQAIKWDQAPDPGFRDVMDAHLSHMHLYHHDQGTFRQIVHNSLDNRSDPRLRL